MKLGILIVIVTLILFVSACSALSSSVADPGYVIINFRGHIFEMSVPMLAHSDCVAAVGCNLANLQVYRQGTAQARRGRWPAARSAPRRSEADPMA